MPNQSNPHSSNSMAQRPRKKKKRPWIAILLVLAVLGAAGVTAERMLRPKTDVSAEGGTIQAQRGNLMVTVTESGSIRAHNSIQYKCEVERRGGEITILSIVPAGTYITQEDVDNGKVLIKLDSSQLEDTLLQEQMELSSDEEQAKSAQEAYHIQELDNESAIAAGKQDLRFALLDLQSYLGVELANDLVKDVNAIVSVSEHVAPVIARALADPNLIKGSVAAQDLKTLEDNIVTAQGALKNSQATFIGTQKLYDANYVSVLDLERDRLDVVNRQFSEQNSHVNLALFKDYTFPKQAEEYLSAYIEKGRLLERTYASCRSQLAQKQASLQNAKLRLQHQQERVDELEDQIKLCTIKAKAPGLVIYGTGGSGDAFRAMRGRGGGGGVIAEGEAVYEGQTLISMPNTAEMIAEIGVHETEVDKVRTGQPAEIVMDAFPDRVLQGEVIEVAPLPDQQRGFLNPDLKVYKTLVKINGSHEFLKTRMSCRVQILVQRLEDVIRVPIQVVANRRGRKVCYVQTADGPEEREVKTGAFNDTFTEITEGLKAGEEVLLNPPMFTEGVSATGQADEERFGGRKAPSQGESSTPGQGSKTGSGQRGSGMRQGRPGMRTEGEPGAGAGPGRRSGQRTGGPRQGQGGPNAVAGGAQFELTDERIDQIISMTKMRDPAKAAEYEKLRKEDPEALKTKIKEDIQTMMNRMRQGGGRQGGVRGGQGGRRGGQGSGGEGGAGRPGNN